MANLFLATTTGYIVDAVAILIIVISGTVALKKGFIRCLMGFVSTFVAILLAIILTKPVISWTNGLFGLMDKLHYFVVYGISFFATFILIKIIVALFSKFISSLIEKIPVVGSLNRILGLLLGLIQGFIIVCGVMALMRMLSWASIETFVNDTYFLKWLYNSNPLITIFSWLANK